MMNKVEVTKRISGSVNPKDKYVMIEKLKDKNKNAQWFVHCLKYLSLLEWYIPSIWNS